MCKRMNICTFKNAYQQNVFINHIYLIYMYEKDVALNNLQRLIIHKKNQTKPNQIIYISYICIKRMWH